MYLFYRTAQGPKPLLFSRNILFQQVPVLRFPLLILIFELGYGGSMILVKSGQLSSDFFYLSIFFRNIGFRLLP